MKHATRKKYKSWNQNLEDKDTVFNRIYIDYADAEKAKPCSIKFKTDNIDDVIKLHKTRYDASNKHKVDNIKVKWDDNPKQSSCKTVLTLNNKDGKKIFVLYFYHAGQCWVKENIGNIILRWRHSQ